MTHNAIKFFPLLLIAFASCNNIGNELEGKLDQLKTKTESLDSLINKEYEKVLGLDSIILKESEKIKKLDSIINKNTSKIDSITSEKIKLYEKIIK